MQNKLIRQRYRRREKRPRLKNQPHPEFPTAVQANDLQQNQPKFGNLGLLQDLLAAPRLIKIAADGLREGLRSPPGEWV
jgi:hypothetical protein